MGGGSILGTLEKKCYSDSGQRSTLFCLLNKYYVLVISSGAAALTKEGILLERGQDLSKSPCLSSLPEISTLSYFEQKPIYESKEVFIVGCQVLILECSSSIPLRGRCQEKQESLLQQIRWLWAWQSRRWYRHFIPQICVGCLLYSRHPT